MTTSHQLSRTPNSLPLWQLLKCYGALCKPKITLLIVLTAWIGSVMGAVRTGSPVSYAGLLGIALLSCAAATYNQILERHTDQHMRRTAHRPLVQKHISPKAALYFAHLLTLVGLALITWHCSGLAALIALAALVGYSVVYTLYLKPLTPQNITLGGLSGALPPLLGWVTTTGHMAAEPWLMVLIIFTWTPPHFWSLCLARYSDYAHAPFPMLPVTHGIAYAQIQIVLYTVLLMCVSFLPWCCGFASEGYAIVALILNLGFIAHALALWQKGLSWALSTFQYSNCYLAGLFLALLW